jgi:hypothetical protein
MEPGVYNLVDARILRLSKHEPQSEELEYDWNHSRRRGALRRKVLDQIITICLLSIWFGNYETGNATIYERYATRSA